MSSYNYDLVVIGAGSGGVRASRVASNFGARVAICESDRVGGTCVIRGCIPKKLLVYAAHYSQDFEDARYYGWDCDLRGFSWERLIKNKDREIDRLNNIYLGILKKAKVDLYKGVGRLVDHHTVQVGDRQISANKILLATGGRPVKPEFPGVDYAITSNEAFHLDSLPSRVVVVGGGYIACEFASIFNGLGSAVTQLYRGSQILRKFDSDIGLVLTQEMRKKGIDVKVGVEVERISKLNNGLSCRCSDGSEIEADVVLFATGRDPNTSGMGLEDIGVSLNERGAVVVDKWQKTNIENIYAVGDVTDRVNLTPVALNEGMYFANTVFGNKPMQMDHDNIASAVFSLPNVASVGLSEDSARQRYPNTEIYKSTFRSLRDTLTSSQQLSMMKIVVDGASERVLGFHMVGPEAAEIIQGLAVALKLGVKKGQLDSTVGIHPTAAEEFVTMREKHSPT